MVMEVSDIEHYLSIQLLISLHHSCPIHIVCILYNWITRHLITLLTVLLINLLFLILSYLLEKSYLEQVIRIQLLYIHDTSLILYNHLIHYHLANLQVHHYSNPLCISILLVLKQHNIKILNSNL